jgi:phage regulator Rha-like protein
MQLSTVGASQTMSSREIADLVRSPHDSVLKTIRRLIEEGIVSGNETPYTHPQNRQTYYEFHLSFRDTMIVASGYSVEMRAKIIDRWQELEAAAAPVAVIPNFANPAEAARAWALQYEARARAEATKAEIGNRREATAMNTASQAVKKANRLEIELDKAKQYATVKRMERLHKDIPFDWRILKRLSTTLGIPITRVFDANYGEVNSYHAKVWHQAYGLAVT